MFIEKIKRNKQNILLYFLVILTSILLKHLPIYTGLVVFCSILLISRKNIFFKIVSIFLIIILTAEILYWLCSHQRITQTILDSIIETNYIELSKMMSSKRILFMLLTSVVVSLCFVLAGNLIEKIIYIHKLREILCIAILTLLATDVNRILFKYRLMADIKEDSNVLGRMLYKKYPLIIGDSAYLITSTLSNDKYKIYNDDLVLNKSVAGHGNTSIENIIIVMGESASSRRFSAYGYHINTTPKIKKIFSEDRACIIENAHSAAPITRDSVAMTFSFATPENEQALFNEKSVIDLAKDNGYKTYWLSSQDLDGLHASKFGYIAKKSDVIKLTKGIDEKLVSLLNTVLQNEEKKFIVIHMAGSHGPYNNFDEIDKKALSNVSKYDLTIHHSDRVINGINTILQSKLNTYALFFTSDHGEIVNLGHGLRGAREQYLVPLMILDKSGMGMCDYVKKLKNKNGYISGLMNKYIISKMLGYKLKNSTIKSEISNDRVLDANNNILPFEEIENYY